MADSCSPEWSSAFIAIKKENPDCKIKLESELMIDDVDQDTPLNIEHQVPQSETTRAVLPGENVFSSESVSVKLEYDPMDDGNFKLNVNQNQHDVMISEGSIEYLSCQATENEPFFKSEDAQEETSHTAKNTAPYSENFTVKLENGLVNEELCRTGEKQTKHDAIEPSKKIKSEILLNEVTEDIAQGSCGRTECRISPSPKSWFKTETDEELRQHSQPLVPFICPHCSVLFKTEEQLEQHSLTHSTAFVCDRCPEQFGTREQLMLHFLMHDPIYCPLCRAVFSSKDRMKQHVATHIL